MPGNTHTVQGGGGRGTGRGGSLIIALLPLGCSVLIYSISRAGMWFLLLSPGRVVPWCRQL